jgi:hypothetical protein
VIVPRGTLIFVTEYNGVIMKRGESVVNQLIVGVGFGTDEDDYELEWDEDSQRYYWRKMEESDYESVTRDQ